MKTKVPDIIPDNCGECKYFIKKGIFDRFKGYCEFYNENRISTWLCLGIENIESIPEKIYETESGDSEASEPNTIETVTWGKRVSSSLLIGLIITVIWIMLMVGGGAYNPRGASGASGLLGNGFGIFIVISGFTLFIKSMMYLLRKPDSMYIKLAGSKTPFYRIEDKMQTINFKAYDINSKQYLGKIMDVNNDKETITIKNDFGNKLIMKFNEVEILEKELNTKVSYDKNTSQKIKGKSQNI